MPKSEIWIQEVPVSLQKVLEDGVGLEGVSAPLCSQHSPQSKGPRNQANHIFNFFTSANLFTFYLCICVSNCHRACVKDRGQPWVSVLTFYLVWKGTSLVFLP